MAFYPWEAIIKEKVKNTWIKCFNGVSKTKLLDGGEK